MNRPDGRKNDELRVCNFHSEFLINATGSALIEQGKTRVICAVSVVPTVPRWMKDQKIPGGWLTSEYQMLPSSTNTRTPRDITRGRLNGRSQEIQRLVGRSLRAVVNLGELGENTVYVDCDVIDADGGTRCACINGASIALQLAFRKMIAAGKIETMPIKEQVAATSVGIIGHTPLLDLSYQEDSQADVDLNVVMTESGKFIEIQGTAEGNAFTRGEMDKMLDLAGKGNQEIIEIQKRVLDN
jgi:ribonuclease PH